MDTTLTPLSPLPVQPRKAPVHRPRPQPAPAPAPPAAPTLVAASCDEAPTLTLVFDRPVDVSGIDVEAIRVDYASLGFSYVGFGEPTVLDPVTVRLAMTGVEEYTGPGIVLSAAAGNGIVAADGGLPWAGVAGVELPF